MPYMPLLRCTCYHSSLR